MKKVAIVQSNYIPWKGYFDMIAAVDEFILYDDMQYTRRDWRNRNKIKTKQGAAWLTIPVATKGSFHQTIKETTVSDQAWAKKHWAMILHNYSKAPCFRNYRAIFEEIYLAMDELYLSKINYRFICAVNDVLGIKTKISWSSDYEIVDGKSERLLSLCEQAGASGYLSGALAKDYLDEALFRKHDVAVEWMDYRGYPEYSQSYPPFEHGVSVLDLIFNHGSESQHYMKSF